MSARSPQHSEQHRIVNGSSQPDTPNNAPPENLATRLERAAQELANHHGKLVISREGVQLTNYLDDYAEIASLASSHFHGIHDQELPVSIAAEWILDNNYILQHAIRQVREDLPPDYYHQLPKLETKAGPDLPRVYRLAFAVLHYEKIQLSVERLKIFLRKYQDTHPLKMGELWAFPTMLRLGIIQMLVRTLLQIVDFDLKLDLDALQGETPPDLAEDEIVANCITGLRFLNTVDWNDFFESISVVEKILCEDPAGIYPQMDFDTRDRYRKKVEEFAKYARRHEWDVAQFVVQMAQEALAACKVDIAGLAEGSSLSHESMIFELPRQCHVGYFLLDRGQLFLKANLEMAIPLRRQLTNFVYDHPGLFYHSSIFLVTVLLLGLLLWYASLQSATIQAMLLVGILSLLPMVTVGVNIVNAVITRLIMPRPLPKMDFSEGIPSVCATIVVVPALLSSEDEIETLLQQIEMHYLRNSDEQLYFGLLTDFVDAPEREMAEDGAYIELASQGIHNLNSKYGGKQHAPFYLFYRQRRWNPGEGVWMGWERKRGKLHELNQLILGSDADSLIMVGGKAEALQRIRYVITLDADTILPRDGAHRLVATLAHPLNQAEFDPETNQVHAGYTILQPRTEILPERSNRSLFTRIFSGDSGLDLYTLAVSDIYQDLFGEGVFVGKGIYDVAGFERSVAGRIPENALLSHDLFEGIHGRTALVTDIVVFEDYPPNYLAEVHRSHRWIRGDWQLLPWLLPRVPSDDGRWLPNRLKIIDRWKILDNLRRSLFIPVLFLYLIAAWLFLPGSPLFWTLVGVFSLGVPVLISMVDVLPQLLTGVTLKEAVKPVNQSLQRGLLALAFLPYETMINLDAILTTVMRLLLDRRGLLQWTTAAHTAGRWGNHIKPQVTWRQMIVAFFSGIIIAVTLLLVNMTSFMIALPILLIWVTSPQLAYLISRPILWKREVLAEEQISSLRALARNTWMFFEQFVGPEDHWLPPDHYQESPRNVVAHRTSPTNIGLGLLATLAAYDFGYIEVLDFVTRLQTTFESLLRLERYRGHFFNWYDTGNLQPLAPRYISTVDSGNLAASLVALREGCSSLIDQPVFRRASWQGLGDLLTLMVELLENVDDDLINKDREPLVSYLVAFQRHLESVMEDSPSWYRTLRELAFKGDMAAGERNNLFTLRELDSRLVEFVEAHSADFGSDYLRRLRICLERIHAQYGALERQINMFMPWLRLLENPPRLFTAQVQGLEPCRIEDILAGVFPPAPTLSEIIDLPAILDQPLRELSACLRQADSHPDMLAGAKEWLKKLEEGAHSASMFAKVFFVGLQQHIQQCQDLADEMDFTFLYNAQRQIFHLGYNLESDHLDSNYYDLLASEARIASFYAMAKGDVPQSHWLHLGRPMTQINGYPVLISWSATMFEYLMPTIFLQDYEGTLLSQSARLAVECQIQYAQQFGIPWGISESGYYHFDANMNYQYRAFGVPDLGYKRGLSEDLVISSYASILALLIQPRVVLENYAHLKSLGMLGTYGLYEAVDFTADRLPAGKKYAIIQSYMAHHQGMIILALVNYLQDGIMVRRVHRDPHIKSVELLLQEQIPTNAPIEDIGLEKTHAVQTVPREGGINHWQVPVIAPQPRPHILSNGRYSVLISSAGDGFSRWQDIDLTRWRPDTTLENWGSWIYLQDCDHPQKPVWSATYQPTARAPQSQEVTFEAHKVEFRRRDDDISLAMEVTVPPDDDLEIRFLTLTNHSDETRHLRLISYAEIILAPQAADERHPAFNKLFIQSSRLPEQYALVFQRRARNPADNPIFLAHTVVTPDGILQNLSYLNDRSEFIGRGQTARHPQAAFDPGKFTSKNVEVSLDPIASISLDVELEPRGRRQIAYITMAGTSLQSVRAIIRRYQNWSVVERAFFQASNYAERELRQLRLTGDRLANIQRLLSVLVYPNHALRASREILAANRRGQPGLWGHRISGDYPILTICIGDTEDLDLVQELVSAQSYWRNHQWQVDLVILNEQASSYRQDFNNQIHRLLAQLKADMWLNRRGGIFILHSDQMDDLDRILLLTASRAVLDPRLGTLAEQLQNLDASPTRLPAFIPADRPPETIFDTPRISRPENLVFDNGLGGFSPDGREYVLYLLAGTRTPLPWVNVIANPEFGFIVSEAGSSTTWAVNSGENRLTPWSNDPVVDPPGEALYLRDEETAEIWSPTPLPARTTEPYLVRHGAGYTIFEHHSHGLKHQLRLFAVPDDPIKVIHLTLENLYDQPRRITATYYAEWVLGIQRSGSQPYIVPEFDDETQALLVHNQYNQEFGERVAFAVASLPLHGLTTDRTEFLGRMGTYNRPAGLERIGLSGVVEAGSDPCAALQVHLDLPGAGTQEFFFILGQGENREQTIELIRAYKDPENIQAAWYNLGEKWDRILGTIAVKTPDPAMDLLLNRWLLYQALSCRIWGRTAFYQSSGAYGFRDQLQDAMALLMTAPEISREHILRAAAHQFSAGDVLHWWHPPSGRGVRTRISDDMIWLPYVTAQYVDATGDLSILDQEVPFKVGPPLDSEADERYGMYATSEQNFSLLEHCFRSIDHGLTFGKQGLPLMGTGDWNDGMNRVGHRGRGESVWLGWFMTDTLNRFASLCDQIGKAQQAQRYRSLADKLVSAIEANAWDGDWYLRAFYDDGSPLGSAQNRECQIDAIAQSWAVIAGQADPERARLAMQAVVERLVNARDGLILLFDPPFDKTLRDPGYIRGYLPGVRENGGQYTHAAVWTTWAFALLGDEDYAGELFRLLNPILHADDLQKVQRYQVEPYVIAADVYSVKPHVGRGGWTWYTGSAAWMYRLGVEIILGIKQSNQSLSIDPRIPSTWAGFEISYRYGTSQYQIKVCNPDKISHGVKRLVVDGEARAGNSVPLVDDGRIHAIQVEMGEDSTLRDNG